VGASEKREQSTPPFPFPERLKREGEPDVPPLIPKHKMPKGEALDEYLATRSAWQKWVEAQPDDAMIFCDVDQRDMWEASNGRIPVKKLHDQRWLQLHMCRRYAQEQGTLAAFEKALDTYWSKNDELRSPPNSPNFNYSE